MRCRMRLFDAETGDLPHNSEIAPSQLRVAEALGIERVMAFGECQAGWLCAFVIESELALAYLGSSSDFLTNRLAFYFRNKTGKSNELLFS
jgi:hypothetical protein